VAIHGAVLLIILFSRSEFVQTQATPLTARIVNDMPEQQAKPEPIRPNTVLEQPKLYVPRPKLLSRWSHRRPVHQSA
jgi:hypothetical protein